MARPQKRTVNYFPHYVTGSRKTLYILESKFGIQGYYFWFRLLELLAMTEGHAYHYTDACDIEYLLSYTKTDSGTADNILGTLANLEAIDKELWNEARIIWSQNFVDGVKDAYKKRVDQLPQKPSLLHRKPTQNDVSGTGNPTKTTNQEPETGKVKESKVKESNNPPIIPPENEKLKLAEYVTMTNAEYEKLLSTYGKEMTARMIEVLDNYKGAIGKKYKSDYRAIQNWVVARVQEEMKNPRAGPEPISKKWGKETRPDKFKGFFVNLR